MRTAFAGLSRLDFGDGASENRRLAGVKIPAEHDPLLVSGR